MKKSDLLTRSQCEAMKGLAILCIMMHNFSHYLTRGVQENEYWFNEENGRNMWDFLSHMTLGSATLLPIYLFTFMGIGVHVFTFMSGYGLVKKYEEPTMPRVGAWRFIRYRYLKLIRLMLGGYLLCMIVWWLVHKELLTDPLSIVAQLTMTINLLPYPGDHIVPGPYWFLGMIMEMYVIYRLLLYRKPSGSMWHRNWPTVAMIALALLAEALCEPKSDLLVYLRYNCIYGALPFGLGVLAARIDWSRVHVQKWLYWLSLPVLVVLMFVANYSFWLWMFIPVFAIVFVFIIIRLSSLRLQKGLAWVGALSAMLFIVHPAVRECFLGPARAGDASIAMRYSYIAVYFLISFVLAMGYKRLLKLLPNPRL